MPEHDAGLLTGEAFFHNITHGCEECFDQLFLRFFQALLSMTTKIVRSEAQDLVQEVFLAIDEQRERFDSAKGSIRTWVL